MEPITRQVTSQSTRSMLVTTLDGGPMVSHTMDAIHHHDDEELSDMDDDSGVLDASVAERTMTRGSDMTIHTDGASVTRTATRRSSMAAAAARKAAAKPSRCPKWLSWYAGAQDATTDDPHAWPQVKKYLILLIVALAGASSPLASTIYYPSLVVMQNDFHTDDTTMNASISIFTFFTAFFPLLWATAGDIIGRRRIYLVSFCISVIGSVCCAVSVNITMFIIFRAISAIGSSSIMSMGAGTIADVFEIHERGRAFAWYTCGPLIGPAIGPIIGGYLNQGLGWRSTFYFLAIFNLCILCVIFFFLPETFRASVASQGDEEKQIKPRPKKRYNPLQALDLLKNVNIVLAVTFVGILFFLLYVINTTFTRTYSVQYGFDTGTVGLLYLPNAVGCMIGGIMGGRLSDSRYNKQVAKLERKSTPVQTVAASSDSPAEQVVIEQIAPNDQQGKTAPLVQPYPELRLGGPVFYGAILLQLVAVVAYGWCVQENVFWAAGVICQFFVGIALMVPNITLSTYMVDCFRTRGASVTACNNFVRYMMAGVGSLISSAMQEGMGAGPMFTFIACLLTVATINLILIQKKGNDWRQATERKKKEKAARKIAQSKNAA
ncbi:major facilitator superfamily domain-containing protein [Gongronella butleri]|nr:major facilitator superfamily domain-containing protein [Gongronella butleri]